MLLITAIFRFYGVISTAGAVAGVLLVTALDVLANRTTVGDWVAMQQYIQNLFQPLAFLGTMYTMIVGAMTGA